MCMYIHFSLSLSVLCAGGVELGVFVCSERTDLANSIAHLNQFHNV